MIFFNFLLLGFPPEYVYSKSNWSAINFILFLDGLLLNKKVEKCFFELLIQFSISDDITGLFPEINVPSTSSINALIFFDIKWFIEIFEIVSFTFQWGLSKSLLFILISPSPLVQLQFLIVSCQTLHLPQV